jgi:nucleoside permease NupC
MLLAFIALVAMANTFISWTGGLFHDVPGLVRFDLLALGIVMTLLWVIRSGAPRDTSVWWGLVGVAVVYSASRAVLPPHVAGTVGAVLLIVWATLFCLMGRTRPVPEWIAPTIIGMTVAANLAFVLFGPLATNAPLSLQMILGWLHWPLAFAMGTPFQDCLQVGKLLGEKLVLTEFVAYADLGAYLGAATRGEVAPLDGRSVVLASYALSGFSNFASIAIQIGGISPMAPSRRGAHARQGHQALICGALASYALASVAGVFYNGTSMLGR